MDLIYANFIVALPDNNNVHRTIEELQSCSEAFIRAWLGENRGAALTASENAMKCFDHLVGEIMRAREDRKASSSYHDSHFQAEMRKKVGKMIAPVAIQDHQYVLELGEGAGKLPQGGNSPKLISCEKTLNKIKHRSKRYANFRIDGMKHVFVICPENPDGTPDSVVEFDVKRLCDVCRGIASLI